MLVGVCMLGEGGFLVCTSTEVTQRRLERIGQDVQLRLPLGSFSFLLPQIRSGLNAFCRYSS